MVKYFIYVKDTDMKTFKALGSNGSIVDKLFYAAMIDEDKAQELLLKLKTNNPECEFKLKKVG
jgi:hypothetical protein